MVETLSQPLFLTPPYEQGVLPNEPGVIPNERGILSLCLIFLTPSSIVVSSVTITELYFPIFVSRVRQNEWASFPSIFCSCRHLLLGFSSRTFFCLLVPSRCNSHLPRTTWGSIKILYIFYFSDTIVNG